MCALVTGVQTCALPILELDRAEVDHRVEQRLLRRVPVEDRLLGDAEVPGERVERRAVDAGGAEAAQRGGQDAVGRARRVLRDTPRPPVVRLAAAPPRSEAHTSELQSLMRISYAV